MSQIVLALRHTPHLEWLIRWQANIIAALAGGSLSAALFSLGALVAVSAARSARSHVAVARRWAQRHA